MHVCACARVNSAALGVQKTLLGLLELELWVTVVSPPDMGAGNCPQGLCKSSRFSELLLPQGEQLKSFNPPVFSSASKYIDELPWIDFHGDSRSP